jgi:hypothetical protein
MADGTPVTADNLAAKTYCNPSLTREWLNAQAASGYVEYADGRFRLPAEQAMALADEDPRCTSRGGAAVLASIVSRQGQTGSGTERFFRPGYRANLLSAWLPSLEGLLPNWSRRQGRRHWVRARSIHRRYGASLSEIALLRLRLSRRIDCDCQTTGRCLSSRSRTTGWRRI